MDAAAHRRFTERLLHNLERDARIVGLVAQGSTSSRSGRVPDAWSDHDFFVVTVPGRAGEVRAERSWLPDADALVLTIQDTPHGCKALWRDGHLAEYAVFEPHELALARSEPDYEVLLDRGGIETSMAQVARATREALESPRDPSVAAGRFIAAMLVAAGRWRRGERLSSRALLASGVAHDLVPLLSEGSRIDPLRQFERRYPAWAAELDAALRLEPDASAVALLDLAACNVPDFPVEAAAAVRRALEETS